MLRGFSHDVEMPPIEPVRRRPPPLRYRDRSLGYGIEDSTRFNDHYGHFS
jgi:hypothetical protein